MYNNVRNRLSKIYLNTHACARTHAYKR